MSSLATALLNELDDAALDILAEKLLPRIAERMQPAQVEDGWLDSKQAGAYLGISVASLHKLTAERAIPFEQDGPGCKCWFQRSKLDAWREAGGKQSNRNSW